MEILKAIIATTEIDRHNERMTLSALEGAAQAINNGSRPYLGIEHDSTIPPLGKMLSAKVEHRSDGEYQLIAESEVFENIWWTELPDGTRLFRQESQIDNRPFASRYEIIDTSGYEISIDPVNFDSYEAASEFGNEIRKESGVDFEQNNFGRKSYIPDPEIIVKLTEVVVAYLLTKKVIDKIAEKVIDDISDEIATDISKFYVLTKSLVFSVLKYVRPKGRPVTYIFVVARKPIVEFVIRTTDPHLVMESINLEKLKPLMQQVEEAKKTLNASHIQFLLNENNEWEFNYLLTKTGGVIGTEKAYHSRNRKFKLLLPTDEKDNLSTVED